MNKLSTALLTAISGLAIMSGAPIAQADTMIKKNLCDYPHPHYPNYRLSDQECNGPNDPINNGAGSSGTPDKGPYSS